MPDINILFAGIIFGLIGVCGLKIGKNQGETKRMVVGAALMVYPYFFEDALLVWGIGVALTAALIWWKD